MKCRVIAVLGTRPEAIKLAVVIRELRRRCDEFETAVVHTGQHRTMLEHVLQLFQIVPDFDLDVMRPNQTLSSLTNRILDTVENACNRFHPHIVLVQGDTTTALGAALAAYYCKIPVAHIEAGLRSHDIYNPFPEELNRRLIGVISTIHFAPTLLAKRNLLAEGIAEDRIVTTGNTVVDTLRALSGMNCDSVDDPLSRLPQDNSKLILVTSHRRESWGPDQESMCLAISDLVKLHSDIRVVYPVHLNPNVRTTVSTLLGNVDRVHLTDPLDYVSFIRLLQRSFLVLTDSGGIQEEAPTFHKPVLVLRKLTERPEASAFGMAKIVGTSRETIVMETSRLLANPEVYRDMAEGPNPYGDGRGSDRIVEALTRWHRHESPLLPASAEFTSPVLGARAHNMSGAHLLAQSASAGKG